MQLSSLEVINQLVKNIEQEIDSVDNLLVEANLKLHEIIITPSGNLIV